MISDLFGWIGDVIGGFFNRIIDIITIFIDVVFAIVAGILYFLYMIGVLAAKLFMLFWEIGSILVSLIVGFARTLQSIAFSPSSGSGHGYSDVMIKIFDTMTYFNLNTIAYILSFLVWFTTAFIAIRTISTFRNL